MAHLLDQFLECQVYCGGKLMIILSILFRRRKYDDEGGWGTLVIGKENI